MKIAIPLLLATVGLSSLALAQGPSLNVAFLPIGKAAELSDPSADVRAAAAAIVAAFGRHDPQAYFALFDPAATFIFYTTPYRLENREAYRREWATWEKDLGFRVRSCASSDQRSASAACWRHRDLYPFRAYRDLYETGQQHAQ